MLDDFMVRAFLAGLGLALVKQLAELNQGDVYLASSSDDGTEFHLTLPVLDFKKSR